MAGRGKYGRSEPVERVKLPQIAYGEAIISAAGMGQPVEMWFADAVAHHLYRCEALQAQERYQADELAAAAAGKPTPDRNDRRYGVQRPRPGITRTPASRHGAGPTGRSQP